MRRDRIIAFLVFGSDGSEVVLSRTLVSEREQAGEGWCCRVDRRYKGIRNPEASLLYWSSRAHNKHTRGPAVPFRM